MQQQRSFAVQSPEPDQSSSKLNSCDFASTLAVPQKLGRELPETPNIYTEKCKKENGQ
jgi:hypothetical protein